MGTGYWGTIVKVDLAAGTCEAMEVREELYRSFLGGSGLVFGLLASSENLKMTPLDPGVPLFFMTGLLTGIPIPAACKGSVCSMSPLTGLWSESTVGGFWPAALKRAGIDGIFVTGRSDKPVYLYVEDGRAEVRPAEHLWGLDTYETSERLVAEGGAGAQVACIGPAGENGVLYASIMFGGHDCRAAGRTGMGAVMGSKRLKAIAVRGDRKIELHDGQTLRQLVREAIPGIRKNTGLLYNYGTAGAVEAVEMMGDLPIKNWQQGSWPEGASRTCGQAMAERIVTGHYACFSCPIRCGKLVRVERGPYRGSVAHGPEYETCAAFGSMVLNDDMDYLAAANDLCNRYGLDTISAGAAVAFALEASEMGLIEPEIEGKRLVWGNGEAVLALLEAIAYRRGAGDLFADGTRRAADRLGGIAREMAVQVKGLEVAFHDPRAFTSMALIYGVGNRGACHLEGLTYFVENKAFPGRVLGLPDEWEPHGSDGKAELAIKMQDYMSVFNPLGLCKFLIRGHVGPEVLAGWLRAVTGWDVTGDGLMTTGEKLFNLRRAINVHMGISRVDDFLPPRLLAHDRREGGAAGSLPHQGKMLEEYYELRGWTREGIPARRKLESLGLADYVALLPPETASLNK